MRRILALSFAMALLGGCAVLDPYVDADDVSNRLSDLRSVAARLTPQEPSPSRADALQEVLEDKAKDYHRFDQVSGLLLIGAGITAAGFGIFNESRDAILAAGLAGGGVAGVRAFVPSAARQRIYRQGAEAANCVRWW